MEITGAGPPVDTPLNPARMALSFLDGVIDAVNISMVSTGRNMHGGIQHLEFDRLADRELPPKPWITRFQHTAAAVHPGAGLIHLVRDGLSQMCSLSTAMRVLVRGIASMVVAVPGGAARAHGRAEGLADPFVDLARCSGGRVITSTGLLIAAGKGRYRSSGPYQVRLCASGMDAAPEDLSADDQPAVHAIPPVASSATPRFQDGSNRPDGVRKSGSSTSRLLVGLPLTILICLIRLTSGDTVADGAIGYLLEGPVRAR